MCDAGPCWAWGTWYDHPTMVWNLFGPSATSQEARVLRALDRAGVMTIGRLRQLSIGQLLRIPGIGNASVLRIKAALEEV